MSNEINTGTGAGANLVVPPTIAKPLLQKVISRAGALTLSDVQTTSSKEQIFPIWKNGFSIGIVGEGAAKPVKAATSSAKDIIAVKAAGIGIFTKEAAQDLVSSPDALMQSNLSDQFSITWDSLITGYQSGVEYTTPHTSSLRENVTQEVVYDESAVDGLTLAVAEALDILDGQNENENDVSVLLSSSFKVAVRQARLAASGEGAAINPYGLGTIDEKITAALDGLPWSISDNLPKINSAQEDDVLAVVGNFKAYSKFLIREDITGDASTEATVVDGGTTHHLWQENKKAFLFEAQAGGQIILPAGFVVIRKGA